MDKIKEMNLEQVELRSQEIATIVKGDTEFDVKELRSELAELSKRREEINVSVELRKQLEQDVIKNGNVIPKKEDNKMEKRELGIESVEYRNAFLKTLRGQELSEIEERAYVHNTTGAAALIPTEMENRIYSNMQEFHPILKDVRTMRTGGSFTIAKHVSIKSGDAKVVLEGAANDAEENEFVNVTLIGKKISKHLEYTYELEAMAMDAFQAYVEFEIAERIGSAQAAQIVAQIKQDLAVENKIEAATPGTFTLDDYLDGLAALKGAKRVNVYASNATIFGHIARLKGAEGQNAFLPNLQDEIAGYLVGKGIKEEDALADGEILILDPNQYLLNIVKPVQILRDRDVKTGDFIVAGHSLTGGSLTNDKAGVMLTVGSAA